MLHLLRLFCLLAVAASSIAQETETAGQPAAAPAHSGIYRTTDENGNVTFTDSPATGSRSSEAVELHSVNTTPAPQPTAGSFPSGKRPTTSKAAPVAVGTAVNILSPANETTIPMGPGNFSVTVQLPSGLPDGQQLQLQVDGAAWGDPQTGTTWAVQNMYRGAHDISVAIIDRSGEQLALSTSIRVYVFRPSVNQGIIRPNPG